MPEAVIVACSSCGAKNRIPTDRFRDRPVCARCGARLGLGGIPFEVTDGDFQSAVLLAPLPVIVDFWAPWCGPCKVVAPELAALAADRSDRVLVAKCNVDRNPHTASRFAVQGVPTLILFHEGREVDRLVGAVPRRAIEAMLGKVDAG
ncbi:MAG: thioredoxin [Planctomycetota bacterium]|jgi:thioredoxin 2